MSLSEALGFNPEALNPLSRWQDYSDNLVLDTKTEEYYYNYTPWNLRIKLLAELTGGLILQVIGLVIGTVARVFRILTCYHFWKEGSELSFQERFLHWKVDVCRIILAPLALPLLIFTAIYGLARPRDGMKIHSRMEIIFHGFPFVATCLHPQNQVKKYEDPSLEQFQVLLTNTVVLHPFKLICSIVYRLLRIVSFFDLYRPSKKSFGERCVSWLKNGGKLLISPLGILLCLGASFYTFTNRISAQGAFYNAQAFYYGEKAPEIAVPPMPLPTIPQALSLEEKRMLQDSFSSYLTVH